MNLQIELTDKIIEAIKAGDAATLTCKVSIKPKKTRKKKEKVPPSDDVVDVIKYWNEHPKRHVLLGERNLGNITPDKASRTQEAIDKFGVIEVSGLIDMYQEQCSSGKYLQQDRNLAYKNLESFCTALLKDTNKWWKAAVVKDEDPELTEWIADSFAVRFLHRNTFGLTQGSQAYIYFQKTQKVLDKIQKIGYNEEDSLKQLLKCVGDFHNGKTISPAMLCSEFTVKTMLPQYFERIGK